MLLFLLDGPRLLGNISLPALGLALGLTFGLAFAPLVLPRHGFLLLIFTSLTLAMAGVLTGVVVAAVVVGSVLVVAVLVVAAVLVGAVGAADVAPEKAE